ncbi:unnamed protein product [Peniophora sp. CBMAI 1063]|nr:unnamed protein product [Peniophora sp. CBMAI 1063]
MASSPSTRLDSPADSTPNLEQLHALGHLLLSHHERTQNLAYLDGAIAVMQHATHMYRKDYAFYPVLVHQLASALHMRFASAGKREDLDSAIAHLRRTVDSLGEADDEMYLMMLLTSYCDLSRARYLQYNDLADIDAVVSTGQRLLDLTPDDYPGRPAWLSALGESLSIRFQHSGNLDDIEASVRAHRQAIQLESASSARVDPSYFHGLGVALGRRAQRTGDAKVLSESVYSLRQAADDTAEQSPNKPHYLSNLAVALCDLFQSSGKEEDIEASISAHQCAVKLTPVNDPNRANYLSLLGIAYGESFRRFGKLEDIEAAVSAHSEAVEITPDDRSSKPRYLHSLGNALMMRFYHLGEVQDIDTSVLLLQRAVALMPRDHVGSAIFLSSLAHALGTRFLRTQQLANIEDSITAYRRVVELTPDAQQSPGHLSNLGVALRQRFLCTGDEKDIEESISVLENAVELTPVDDPFKPLRLNNLADALVSRSHRTGAEADLELAIDTYRRAIKLTPQTHPDMPGLLLDTGIALEQLHELTGSSTTLDEAIEAFRMAILEPVGHISVRLQAALRYTLLTSQFRGKQTILRAYSHVMDILLEVVWLGYSVDRRYEILSNLGKLVNAAVAAAIDANDLPQAVEWAEAGRSLVWSQIVSLRTPVDELAQAHPDLARSLQAVQEKLRQSWNAGRSRDFRPEEYASGIPVVITHTPGSYHRELVIEYERLIAAVRACSGFQDFLRPKKYAALLSSLDHHDDGPIVIINVHPDRCDALVVCPGKAILLVPLPDLSSERAIELRRQWMECVTGHGLRTRASGKLGLLEPKSKPLMVCLERMWTWIVRPVLESLDLANLNDRLSHITWCPTGPLTQLPLHAAGIYDDPSGPRIYDFVVSSYTPSMSAIQQGHRKSMPPMSAPEVLVVTQSETPGHAPLPGTVEERDRLKATLDRGGIQNTIISDGDATIEVVKSAMNRHQWVHLACHGSQNQMNATQSAFHLYDGPLTLSDLMGIAADNAKLAFLSACQTAVGDEKVPEESAHLAAGMLAVGFKGVVATMWSIHDADAPVVVEAFYRELLALRQVKEAGGKGAGAAYALHEATRVLRDSVGEQNFMRWVPFVHFGV